MTSGRLWHKTLTRLCGRCLPLAVIPLLATAACLANEETREGSLRYRGDYTLAHEVNTFCPHLSSRCYWLSPSTGEQARAALASLAGRFRSAPYSSVCVLISGSINRGIEREGFAADHDGLIRVDSVYGQCNETSMVAQGDLQHHRWLLTRIDDQPLLPNSHQRQPALDFGERMFYSANHRCQEVSGFARLEQETIVFEQSDVQNTTCTVANTDWASDLSAGPWRIQIPTQGVLVLQRSDTRLEFNLDDWR